MAGNAFPYHVLIVEDEYFIAHDLVRALKEDGLEALGPVSGPAAALLALDQQVVDFAVVDINFDGDISFEIATELRRRAIPFLFPTGYDTSVLPAEFDDAVLLQKPNDGKVIVAEIVRQRLAASL